MTLKTPEIDGTRPGPRLGTTPPDRPKQPRVAVIGGGSSGLVTVKTLLEYGLDVVCFEQGRDVGGLWVYNNSNGRGGTYRSLHINTSKIQTQFPDFPMPDSWGDYPHHSDIARYLASYAHHFKLIPHIRFEHEVIRCRALTRGGYEIAFKHTAQAETFDAIVVANGHHFLPLLPESRSYETFTGQTLHSYDYRSPTEPLSLAGKRVVVVGMGNSAMDIACELSRIHPTQVSVSARRGAWVMPKYLRGKPIDGPAIIPHYLPAKLRRKLVTRAFQFVHGSMTDFGLPEPDHLIGEAHPTISTEFPSLVKSGDIKMRAGLSHCEKELVHFNDGSSTPADVLIFCTGYRVDFPFFEPDHIQTHNNQLPLFFRTFHLSERHVFFVGLLQTIGAVMPVAAAQARAIALHLAGQYNLPLAPEMQHIHAAHDKKMKEQFVPSVRHTMQIIPEDFQVALAKELAAGARRAHRSLGQAFSLQGADT